MNSSSAVLAVVEKVKLRQLTQLFITQSALALAAGLCGLIALLVAGTQILGWFWPLLLLAAAAGIGWFRVQRRIPSVYAVAQQIDRRACLEDALSTAYFFRDMSGPVVETQRQQAEAAATAVDVLAVAPYRWPRAAIASLALLAAAVALIGVRYGVLRTLDLRRPLVAAPFGFFGAPERAKVARSRPADQKLTGELEGLGLSIDESQREQMSKEDNRTADMSDLSNIPGAMDEDALAKMEGVSMSPEKGEAGEAGERTQAGDESDSSGPDSAPANPHNGKSPPPNAPKVTPQNPAQGGENSSLLEKMREAMNNLLSKLKIPDRPGEAREAASSQRPGQRPGDQLERMSQRGMPSPGRPQGENQTGAEMQGDQTGQGEKSQSGQGESNDRAGDKNAPKDAKSAAGRADGDKSIQDAEMLQAMGKLSEIFGKRQQNITGDVLMEVSSGKQQLKTQYSERQATHSDAGGEISRDEVPLAYQHYVQQYFDQIRKNPGQSPQSPESGAPVKPPAPASQSPAPRR